MSPFHSRLLLMDSIFTKIIKGEIPCHKIYEDEQVIAFLDIHPVQLGHVLVVPKIQVEHFEELDEEMYSHLFLVVKKIAKRVKHMLGVNRACLKIEGFEVPHAHIHVIPCNEAKDFYAKQQADLEPDHAALAQVAESLNF